jgi:hypothetical protein
MLHNSLLRSIICLLLNGQRKSCTTAVTCRIDRRDDEGGGVPDIDAIRRRL